MVTTGTGTRAEVTIIEAIADIVREALGEAPSSVEHVPTLEDSHVFRVVFASGTVFFKSEHEGHPIAVAAWAYRKARSIGIPVPDVLHLDLSRERWAEEFMIVTGVPGTDLEHDPLTGHALIEAIEGYGELLRRLHGEVLEGFGDLDFRTPGAEAPTGEFATHAASVRVSWGLGYLLEQGLLSPQVGEQIVEVMDRHEELLTAPVHGVFNHGDPGLDHLFVDRGTMKITGLIDFEPESADPATDLAAFAYHLPDLIGHLLHGYGEVPADLPLRLELYGLMQAVGSVRWEHERVPHVTPAVDDLVERAARTHALLR